MVLGIVVSCREIIIIIRKIEQTVQQIFISFLAHFIRSNPLVELVWLHNSMNNPFSSLKLLKIDKWANFQIKSFKISGRYPIFATFYPKYCPFIEFSTRWTTFKYSHFSWEHNFAILLNLTLLVCFKFIPVWN